MQLFFREREKKEFLYDEDTMRDIGGLSGTVTRRCACFVPTATQ